MERFSLILVYWATMCVLVHSHVRPPNKLWTLYFKTMSVRVKTSGEIVGKNSSPTLFNLLKEKTYGNKLTNGSERFSLEAIATGNLICMNRKGIMYTMEDELWKPRQRRVARSEGRLLPPEDCLFKSVDFDSYHTFERAVGIYSVAHSNATIGRFITFTRNGKARSCRKPFQELVRNTRIRINLTPVLHFDDILSNTIFGKDPEFNARMTKCIRKENELKSFQPKLRHSINSSNLKKVIHKCKLRVQRKLRAKRGKPNRRPSMKRDSRQRRKSPS